jgi:hypothetical protein
MATTREFELGETVEIYVEVKDQDGTLVDATTSITTTIYNPDGTVAQAADGMTNLDTGKYDYFYTTVTQTGWYRVRITVTDLTKITIKDGGFNVK